MASNETGIRMATPVYRCTGKDVDVKLNHGTHSGKLGVGDVIEAVEASGDGKSVRFDVAWTLSGGNFTVHGWVRVDKKKLQRLPNCDANAWKTEQKPQQRLQRPGMPEDVDDCSWPPCPWRIREGMPSRSAA